MWCTSCRQNIPRGRSSGLSGVCEGCATHGYTSQSTPNRASHGVADCGLELPTSRKAFSSRVLSPDDWTFESEIRRAQRMVKTGADLDRLELPSLESLSPSSPLPMNVSSSIRHRGEHQFGEAFETPAAILAAHSDSRLAWLTILVGLLAFIYGLTLLGVSFMEGQAEKWRFGLPIMLLGQFGLLLGVIIKLSVLQKSSRQVASRVQSVDMQVRTLGHETARQRLI
ncbi:MAG: hypothetical protein SGJ20_04840 [Planctomycetota bacterium]|nr:hypothetical protein [Planctomycetota bacterium]